MRPTSSKLPFDWGSIALGVFLTAIGASKIVAALLHGRVLDFTFADHPTWFVVGFAVLGLMLACGLTLLWYGISELVKRNRNAGGVS
jgi:hypothetical protein